MNTNYVSKFYNGAIFSGILMLALFGIFASNVMAQKKLAEITINKDVCDSVGQSNTCNGGNSELAGRTIEFTVEDLTTNTLAASVFVKIDQGNDSKATSGVKSSGEILTPDDMYRVCEANVPSGFDALPRPGNSTGGQQTTGGPGFEDCIIVTAQSGNNVLKFINLKISVGPTAARAMVAGRVQTDSGKFRGSVQVTILNTSTLETQTVITNRLGYYQFEDLAVGDTYIVTVRSKGFAFAPQTFTLNDDNALNMQGYAVSRSKQ